MKRKCRNCGKKFEKTGKNDKICPDCWFKLIRYKDRKIPNDK